MDKLVLAKSIAAIMVAVAPPGRSPAPAAKETAEEGVARYQDIATSIVDVAFDTEEPPAFGSRDRTALVLAAISFHESGWRKDVDNGTVKGPNGDCGLFQANLGGAKTKEGWSCSDLVADRRKAARHALHLARQSWLRCGQSDPNLALTAYASGRCSAGIEESKAMMSLARRWSGRLAPPKESTPSAGASN